MPAYGTVEADEIAALPYPVTWRVGRFSSEIALAPRLQMRGLETVSTTRRNGRGPDSSLKRQWVFVWIHVHTVAALWTVTHWVTVRMARDIYIRRRRVPLSEIFPSISENFHLAHTNGTGQSCVEVNASAQYGLKSKDHSPSRPEGWPVFE